MKDQVLKIIRERIVDLDVSSIKANAYKRLELHAVVCELKDIVDAISALPEQGYTREQKYQELIEALEIYQKGLVEELNITSALAYVHGWRSERYEEGVKLRESIARLKDELSSLTPVAVEAEQGPEATDIIGKIQRISEHVNTMTAPMNEQFLRGDKRAMWEIWTTLIDVLKENAPYRPPSDSLAPQVNNDKTK